MAGGRCRGIYTPPRNVAVAVHLDRSLRTWRPETPAWAGDSGPTPDQIPQQPLRCSSSLQAGNSGLVGRKLRTGRNLRAYSGATLDPIPHAPSRERLRFKPLVRGGVSGPRDRKLRPVRKLRCYSGVTPHHIPQLPPSGAFAPENDLAGDSGHRDRRLRTGQANASFFFLSSVLMQSVIVSFHSCTT